MNIIEEEKRIGFEYEVIQVLFIPHGSESPISCNEFFEREEAAKWIKNARKTWASKNLYYSKIQKTKRISWNSKIKYSHKQDLRYNQG